MSVTNRQPMTIWQMVQVGTIVARATYRMFADISEEEAKSIIGAFKKNTEIRLTKLKDRLGGNLADVAHYDIKAAGRIAMVK